MTLNSRIYLEKGMKIICEYNMCNIWHTSHIYIIRSGVCQYTFYIISASLHVFYASFYPNKREK